MNLASLPKMTGKTYLRQLNDDFALAEGNIPEDQWAYVIVKFIVEGDRIARNELTSKRETRLHGAPDTKFDYTETVKDNIRERVELEAFLAIYEVKNLTDEEGEVFPSAPVRDMGRDDFKSSWRSLPPYAADALHAAVVLANPEWDWGA